MKAIIIYATKSGASLDCAEALAPRLPGVTVRAATDTLPDLVNFDTIILGSGVRMGKIYTPMRQLIKKNMELLCTKNVSIYLCNAYPEAFEKAVTQNIPEQLIHSATQIVSLGGKPPFRRAAKTEWLNQDALEHFADLSRTRKI